MPDKRAYFKVDVGYLTNPKVALLAIERPQAVLLHLASIAYSAQHLTDGRVPLPLILRLNAATQEDADQLISCGLWESAGDGYVTVHDYLEHQRSAVEVKAATEKAKHAADVRWSASSMPDALLHAVPDAVPNGMPREREERDTNTARSRGSRIPQNFTATDELRQWAEEAGYGHLDLTAITASFNDYWLGVPGAKGVKLDWPATWRGWIRREASNPRAPRKPKVDQRPEGW